MDDFGKAYHQHLVSEGDKKHRAAVEQIENLNLSDGTFVKTRFGWEGIITLIEEWAFRFGQGVSIIRVGDNAKFCIHPTDINEVVV